MTSPLKVAIRASMAVVMAGMSIATATGAQAEASDEPKSLAGYTARQVADGASRYIGDAPDDYIGLEKRIRALGGVDVRFNIPTLGLSNATASEASTANSARARVVESQTRSIDPSRFLPSPRVSIQVLPSDLFSVSSLWYKIPTASGGAYYQYHGKWDFKDSWANGSAPYDVSAIALNKVHSCWKFKFDSTYMYTYSGMDKSGSAWRYDSSDKSSIWKIQDKVSSFVINNDHGTHVLSYYRSATKDCSGTSSTYAKYYYEHNQDGSGGWSASVSVLGLGVSYTGSPGQKMRKATAIDYV